MLSPFGTFLRSQDKSNSQHISIGWSSSHVLCFLWQILRLLPAFVADHTCELQRRETMETMGRIRCRHVLVVHAILLSQLCRRDSEAH